MLATGLRIGDACIIASTREQFVRGKHGYEIRLLITRAGTSVTEGEISSLGIIEAKFGAVFFAG